MPSAVSPWQGWLDDSRADGFAKRIRQTTHRWSMPQYTRFGPGFHRSPLMVACRYRGDIAFFHPCMMTESSSPSKSLFQQDSLSAGLVVLFHHAFDKVFRATKSGARKTPLAQSIASNHHGKVRELSTFVHSFAEHQTRRYIFAVECDGVRETVWRKLCWPSSCALVEKDLQPTTSVGGTRPSARSPSGISGPTQSKPAKSFRPAQRSAAERRLHQMATHSASAAMPPFPGAHQNFSTHRTLFQFPHQRVFASAAAQNQNLHAQFPPPLYRTMTSLRACQRRPMRKLDELAE